MFLFEQLRQSSENLVGALNPQPSRTQARQRVPFEGRGLFLGCFFCVFCSHFWRCWGAFWGRFATPGRGHVAGPALKWDTLAGLSPRGLWILGPHRIFRTLSQLFKQKHALSLFCFQTKTCVKFLFVCFCCVFVCVSLFLLRIWKKYMQSKKHKETQQTKNMKKKN